MDKNIDRIHVVSAHYNLLPYHAARYAGFVRHSGPPCQLTALLVRPTDDYKLLDQRYSPQQGFAVVRNTDGKRGGAGAKHLATVLDELKVDALLLLGGYAGADMLSILRHGIRRRIPLIICSESKSDDEKRRGIVELLKGRVIRLFSSALVGGSPHAEYMVSLGMPRDSVMLGYDAVDNEYFAQGAGEVRGRLSAARGQLGVPERYFLASARFIEKKNLARLLQAYARYRTLCEDQRPETTGPQEFADVRMSGRPVVPWSLVLLGDGPLRGELERLISDLRLQSSVTLPGFKQYPDLPAYYGLASAFIHPSTTEQWGLVVNEAMASGLPVLVSKHCGCAPDLVQEGVNGFSFDPYSAEDIAGAMLRIAAMEPAARSRMGDASRRIIADWGPDRFACGLKAAVDKALEVGPKSPTLLDRMLLAALSMR